MPNGTKKGDASGDDETPEATPAEELSLEDAIHEVEAAQHARSASGPRASPGRGPGRC